MTKYMILATLAFVLSACNSGGSRIKGSQCLPDANPIPLEMADAKSVKLEKGSQDTGLPPGVYEFQGAELFYVNEAEDIRMQLHYTAKGEWKRGCMRGLSADLMIPPTAASAVTAMTVYEDGAIEVSAKEFEVSFSDEKINHTAEDVPNDVDNPPDDVYKKVQAEYKMFRRTKIEKNESPYELRAKVRVTPQDLIYITTRFTQKSLPEIPVEAAPTEVTEESPSLPTE